MSRTVLRLLPGLGVWIYVPEMASLVRIIRQRGENRKARRIYSCFKSNLSRPVLNWSRNLRRRFSISEMLRIRKRHLSLCIDIIFSFVILYLRSRHFAECENAILVMFYVLTICGLGSGSFRHFPGGDDAGREATERPIVQTDLEINE